MSRSAPIDFRRVVERGEAHWEIQRWSGTSIYTLGIITDEGDGFVVHDKDPSHPGDWMPVATFLFAEYGTRRKAITAAKRAALVWFGG